MEKKVISAMFANICANDELRPMMCGVHFEEERCYASDGKVLVIYNEGSKKLDGKTILKDGTEVQGRYPNVDSVVPAEEGKRLNIDIKQLHDACLWHIKKSSTNDNLVINSVGYNIKYLTRLLNTLVSEGNPKNLKFYNSSPDRATVIKGNKFFGLVMPVMYEEADIDAETDDDCPTLYSYETFINDYVFNSWKKEPQQKPLDWLD